jgi:ketohexokinase
MKITVTPYLSSILFCTWGAQGATCLQSATNQILSAPALNINQVVDTVGAGDTFTAGVMYGLSHGFDMMDVLTFACELAGRKVAQTGFDGLRQQLDARWNDFLCE